MYHIFFVHLSVDGHLSCFCVLAIVNSAAVNTGCRVFFRLLYVFVAEHGLSLVAAAGASAQALGVGAP